MKVCIITYDTSHAKTSDIFFQMRDNKELEISFLLAPFSRRPERQVLFKHRPEQFVGPEIRELAESSNLKVWEYDDRREAVMNSDYLVIGGANILEPELANCGKIINGHAGIIPMARGLDAFKWAILDGKPIGNTLHIIDEHADAGSILHQEITPLFHDDSLQTFADRHYRNEIRLLSTFNNYINSGTKFDFPVSEPRMRMPIRLEQEMMDAFPAYKEKYAHLREG